MRGGARDPSRAIGFDELSSSLPALDALLWESMRRHTGAPNGTIRVVPPAAPPRGVGEGRGAAADAGSSSAAPTGSGGNSGSERDDSSSGGGAACGFSLGPYEFLPGTTVWVPFCALHNAGHNWEEPAAFKLSRWLPAARAGGGCPLGFGGGGGGSQGSSSGGEGSGEGGRAEAAAAGGAFMPFSDGARSCPGKPLALLELRLGLAELLAAFEVSLAPEAGGPDAVLAAQRATLTLEPEGGLWVRLAPRRVARGALGVAEGAAAGADARAAVAAAP
jgi:hypothetical protein